MNARVTRGVAAIVAALTVSASGFVSAGEPETAPDHDAARLVESVPNSKKVYMVTDSVGLGAQYALPRAFPADWQVVVEGRPAGMVDKLENEFVRPRAQNSPWVLGDHAIVAAGYNYPYWSPAHFDSTVDSMIATLTAAGVKHVYWVTLREVDRRYVSASGWHQIQPYSWYFPEVNDRLELALERHANLTLIDWAANANQPGLTYDAIHLNNTGSALYSQLAREAVDATTTSVADRSVTPIKIPGAGPGDAVALNLTTTDPRHVGYLSAYPCDGPMPVVSNHNYARGQVVAHSVVVPVSAAGEVCVFTRVQTNLVVDITGRFDADADILHGAPTRLVDTRTSGNSQPQQAMVPLVVDVGPSLAPQVLSVTSVDAASPGWVRAAPCGSTSTTSNLNMNDASAIPNAVIVAPADDGTVCVTSSTESHLIVDSFVRFGDETGVEPADPRRVLDTRELGGTVAAGGTVRLTASDLGLTDDAHATAVMLNLTATQASGPGYLTAYPCELGAPDTSNVNYSPGTTIANFAIIEPDANGDVCVFTLAAGHIVVDLMGSITSGFRDGTPTRLLDTRTLGV